MPYLEHFNLREQPFRLTPDPEFLYWSKQHARAKAYMESTIWLADGFVVITGEIGSGKTTLLQSFLDELDDDVVCAVVSQTQLTPTQFLQAVLTEFGFKPFDKRKVELLDMLNMFLIEQYSNGKKVVLIVDEAQNLMHRVLEEIRLISGIETHKEKVLRIILAGQPELKDKLDSPGLKQEYVSHRLSIAGRADGKLFEEDAFEIIQRYSGGVPRLINTLCDTAMLCSFADGKPTVSGDDIMSAVAELDWKEHESTTGRYRKMQQVTERLSDSNNLSQIEVRTDGERISVQSFPAGRIIVGRSPDNEIYIKSKFVSRHHAQLVSDESGCTIEDLNSTNGVFLGEKQVKKQRLNDGDVVTLGSYELVYTDLRRREPANEEDFSNDDDGDDEASVVGE
jgi:general secretion pathway protein A